MNETEFDNRIMAEDPLMLTEIGERFNISRERVRQIQAQISRNLAKNLRSSEIRPSMRRVGLRNHGGVEVASHWCHGFLFGLCFIEKHPPNRRPGKAAKQAGRRWRKKGLTASMP
jgi:hypothetical protein